jgi:hypothetical protein
LHGGRLFAAWMKAHPRVEPTSPRRRPRRLKEILLAVFLTAAAAGFIAAALLRDEGSPGAPSVEAARKPFSDNAP